MRSERAVVASGVALLVLMSWWFVGSGAGMPGDMHAAPPFGALLLMWWLMMVAMMLPSAAPAVLLYAKVRAVRAGDAAVAQTWIFLAGYLAVWLLFSLAAAAAHRLLAGSSMTVGNGSAPGILLVAAGLYQLGPVKNACLGHCRSPTQFLTRHWRPGAAGAIRLGVLHGAYCVGCCWLLMALLFVGGVMNFAWIVGLTLVVAVEKLVPGGAWIGRAAGVALIGWGLALLLA